MNPTRTTRNRKAFSLAELLVVIGIIALLIAILVPALSSIRDKARQTNIAGKLGSIGKGLDIFSTDFGEYPDSTFRYDPIDWQGVYPTKTRQLSGAHWLARAMAGHDLQGVDAQGFTLRDAEALQAQNTPLRTVAQLADLPRKSRYVTDDLFARDNDKTVFPGPNGDDAAGTSFRFLPTGQFVMYEDQFGSPILYYRANRQASEPFCYAGNGKAKPGASGDRLGIYRQADNARLAGGPGSGAIPATFGWNYSGRCGEHQMRDFGWDPQPANGLISPRFSDRSFVGHLADRSVVPAGSFNAGPDIPPQLVRPHNPERFILLSAGKDMTFGTEDDVGNFTINP